MTRWYFSHEMNLVQFKGALKVFVHDFEKLSKEDREKVRARTADNGDLILELD